jgi:hypothetical protein
MDDVLAGLEALAVGLALVLAVIALMAARRYSDRRFAFIGIGLAALGLVSLVGLISLISPDTIPNGGLGYPPVVLVLLAEIMLYLSLTTKRTLPAEVADE